jgi:transcription elongation factor GreB
LHALTGRNYMTPAGARKLTEELKRLIEVERPKTVDEVATAAAHGDRSENAEYKYGKLRLREIDRRIRFLQKRLDAAVVVDPKSPEIATGAVVFGAIVRVADEEGRERRYQLVGEDESDPAAGKVSWRSPIGSALLKKRVGDIVVVRRPAGDLELEIIEITYET